MKHQEHVTKLLKKYDAYLTNGHFVYAYGRHGPEYIDKSAIYADPVAASRIGINLGAFFWDSGIETVIGPATGGAILSQWTAHHVADYLKRPISSTFADKDPDTGNFFIRGGFHKHLRNRRVVVVEDVVNSGDSVKKVIQAVRDTGGEVIGVGAIVNRDGRTAGNLGIPIFNPLLNLTLKSWDASSCDLCRQGIPVNADVGHGRKAARHQK
jgi:orotate phosphoribosyltransferase